MLWVPSFLYLSRDLRKLKVRFFWTQKKKRKESNFSMTVLVGYFWMTLKWWKINLKSLNTSKGKPHQNFIVSSTQLVTNPLEMHTCISIYSLTFDCQKVLKSACLQKLRHWADRICATILCYLENSGSPMAFTVKLHCCNRHDLRNSIFLC